MIIVAIVIEKPQQKEGQHYRDVTSLAERSVLDKRQADVHIVCNTEDML